jgi:hypothetical protein
LLDRGILLRHIAREPMPFRLVLDLQLAADETWSIASGGQSRTERRGAEAAGYRRGSFAF